MTQAAALARSPGRGYSGSVREGWLASPRRRQGPSTRGRRPTSERLRAHRPRDPRASREPPGARRRWVSSFVLGAWRPVQPHHGDAAPSVAPTRATTRGRCVRPWRRCSWGPRPRKTATASNRATYRTWRSRRTRVGPWRRSRRSWIPTQNEEVVGAVLTAMARRVPALGSPSFEAVADHLVQVMDEPRARAGSTTRPPSRPTWRRRRTCSRGGSPRRPTPPA